MNQNKITFESENLVVDWISFNAKGLTDPQPIAKYLLGFGFNSLQCKSCQEGHTEDNVIFSRPIKYWNGTVISFSGQNATYFYQLIKQKSIHFTFFQPIQLGRLDLHYFRKAKLTDDISVQGPIFTIGNRKSSKFFRIYQKINYFNFFFAYNYNYNYNYKNLYA